ERMVAILDEVSRSTGKRLLLPLEVLSRRDWATHGPQGPYGIPGRLPSGGLGLPARADASVVKLWEGLLGNLPEIRHEPYHQDRREVASLEVIDALGAVSAARILLEEAGFKADQHWVEEILAHAEAEVGENANGDEPAVLSVFAAFSTPSKPLFLAAFANGLSYRDWLAYQQLFHRAADVLVSEAGPRGLRKLIRHGTAGNELQAKRDLLTAYPSVARVLSGAREAPK
ncbi:MAG TPA: hypothetical protein VKA53_03540, partial [Thermoanaerobaculia bacterium]|nr:hypothetical protein [Thermoanaerobaculia bacterium]